MRTPTSTRTGRTRISIPIEPRGTVTPKSRTPLGAFGIGLLHGIGGSAGVGILLVSTIDERAVAIAALAILATFTAVSMTLLTTGFGLTLAGKPIGRFVPALGTASLAFGLWYALGAQGVLPYYF